MKCYKCGEEIHPITDTAWRKHNNGVKCRATEFFCAECRIWIYIKAEDYSECIDLFEEEE